MGQHLYYGLSGALLREEIRMTQGMLNLANQTASTFDESHNPKREAGSKRWISEGIVQRVHDHMSQFASLASKWA